VIAAIAFIAQVQGYNVGLTRAMKSQLLMAGRTMKSQLLMAGGKSQAEKKLTTGVIFKNLRDKLNKAAETPGFFDTGVKPEIDLYCKSNKDGTQIGDCPFAQFVQLVMLKKGIKYNIFPTLAENKPSWLKEKHDGKLPAIVHNGVTMTESLAIAEYIEKNFPHSSLTRQGAYSYQEVIEKMNGFWPALTACIKNKDASKDGALLAAVEKQLDLLDEIIRSTPGQYMCGIELTLADLYLTPQLYHAMVALEHFKGYTFYHMEGDATRLALENYIARMFDSEEFNDKKAYYNVDQVISGWKAQRE